MSTTPFTSRAGASGRGRDSAPSPSSRRRWATPSRGARLPPGPRSCGSGRGLRSAPRASASPSRRSSSRRSPGALPTSSGG
eukprot:10093491-Alexandrium_andersonii.AAC.1